MNKIIYSLLLVLGSALLYIGVQTGTPETVPPAALPTFAPVVPESPSQPESASQPDPTARLENLLEDNPLFSPLADAEVRNFDEMIDARVIRALVVYSKTSYFLDGAVQRGLDFDFLSQFEKFVNKSLNTGHLKVHMIFIPVTREEILPALLAGRGDLAVANLTITPERQRSIDFSRPVFSAISELLISQKQDEWQPQSIDELSGREIHLRRSSSYYSSLTGINEQLSARGLAPARIRVVDEKLEDEDLLEMLNAGLISTTVVDSHKARFWQQIFEDIRLHEQLPLRDGANVAWAMRKNSPHLLAMTNKFIKTHRGGTLYGNMMLQRYLKNTSYVENSLSTQSMQRFRDTAPVFRKYAKEYEFDWLMLMAQAYQESRLNQTVRSSAGAVGIMQIKPSTAADKRVNVKNIGKLDNNVHAGTRYLRFLRDHYFGEEDMDETEKTLFAFAAYNAGPSRVINLRREAASAGLNPNLWFGNVEVIAARRIGRETVQYVSNIYKYWMTYRLAQHELKDRAASAPAT
ncbi:transporter substrate-binding domain-containing protein [Halieaceae bacterium IMCC14734]|uniref:Transporter substrate-binding domain-containing protein n=1 Tax=Candidatus Litorirhabdus singularis TaxID=2518993 RepID=A0ABT3TFP2_9GAMM|nr:transporter substrate-binding domain-containing protein [Candidatus Litorirhabdus singularis]MCX2981127.1 transporter substrate-binding domain-containing protein [Candidatus Litorirhabdus singularis]